MNELFDFKVDFGHFFEKYNVLISIINFVYKKPKNLKHVEASAIPFTGLTAWSSMMVSAGLSSEKLNRNANFKILVIGASGGVGTFAVQLLKALNYSVVAVTEEFELLDELGADVVLDHTDPDYYETLRSVTF